MKKAAPCGTAFYYYLYSTYSIYSSYNRSFTITSQPPCGFRLQYAGC